jgi:hypothetical protein
VELVGVQVAKRAGEYEEECNESGERSDEKTEKMR